MKNALAAALFALVASPALAGDVLIPIAANAQSNANLVYTTKIWVSNTGNATASFTTRFIPSGTDGTKAPAPSSPVLVAPGATVVLTGVGPAGASGTLSLVGASTLAVVAKLESFLGGQSVGVTDVPAISAASATAAGVAAQLPGLQRINGTAFTDLYLYNLETKAAQCTLRVFQANGAAIGSPAVLPLLPLQRRDFVDTMNQLGIADIVDARVQVVCDKKFSAGALLRRTSGEVAYTLAAATLASAVLGGGDPLPPPTGDVVTFTVSGLFLSAVNGNSYKAFDLPTKANQAYKTAVVEFDLQIGHFPDLLFTGVHSLRRGHPAKSSRVLYYGLQVVNRNSKTTLDLGVQDVLARGDGPWQEGHFYHLKITYDVPGRLVRLEVFENGNRKQNLSGQAQHLDLSDGGQGKLSVDFGMTGIADGAYAPPISWKYSNLKVVLTP